ncbi:MAG: MFS transporter [bacterium]|nr:MFS transporter [bacterium]
MEPKPFWFSKKMFFLMAFLFAIAFAVLFYLRKDTADEMFSTLINAVPSIRNYGMGAVEKVRNIIPVYGALVGVGFALVFMLMSLLFQFVLFVIRLSPFRWSVPLSLLVGLAPLVLFGGDMVYYSARFTALSGGIIIYLGYPLLYTGLIIAGISALLFLASLFSKSTAKNALVLIMVVGSAMTLSGCDWLNQIISTSCEFSSDPTHCYQESAVGSGESENCDTMPQSPDFEGSNPPKDKCYVMVAQNTGDPTACDKIAGGFMSYSKEECLDNVFKEGNPDKCVGSANEVACRNLYAQRQGGNCGTGFAFDEKSGSCQSSSDAVDPECADPTFTSQCASSNSVLICSGGKKRIESCAFGCFQADCRTSPGETDIAPEPEGKVDKDDKDDKEDKEEPKCECSSDQVCVDGACISVGCQIDADCGEGMTCLDKACVEKSGQCLKDADCPTDFTCEEKVCISKPACNAKDLYCLSTTTLQFCEEGQVSYKTCDNGCDASHCLTAQEKADKDKENEKENACKEGVNKCLSEVTLETCYGGEKETEKCEFGCEGSKCRTEKKKKCTGIQRLNPFCSEDDEDIEDKVASDLSTIQDAVGGKYMELLDEAIDGETNPAKLRGLEKYKEFLEKAGGGLEEIQASVESLKALKRIFLDAYDPSMDIQNMPVKDILKPGLFDRISQSIWGGPKTEAGIEMAEAEDGLSVYEAMLKRQAEIDFLQQSRLSRLGGIISENAKSKMVSEISDKAKDIAEGVAGDAMIAVSVVDYALTSFQDEAKKQAFVGLARAYNRRRADLEQQFPDMENEDIHKMVVEQVKDQPYQDAKGNTFIKYGNIIENQDCQAGTGNQLCIDNRVFWTSMEKSYEYTHDHELHDRFIQQFDRKLEKAGVN